MVTIPQSPLISNGMVHIMVLINAFNRAGQEEIVGGFIRLVHRG